MKGTLAAVSWVASGSAIGFCHSSIQLMPCDSKYGSVLLCFARAFGNHYIAEWQNMQ